MVEKTLFIIFAALAIGGALGVITRKNIVHALILLIFTFLNVAAIFILTEAFFLAVLQVLVYAGAIMVLFTFVIMFLNLREFAEMEQLHPTQKWAALILAPIMLAEFVYVFVSASFSSVGGDWTPEAIASAGGNVKAMGITLFNDMQIPFEWYLVLSSFLLVIGMAGILSRRNLFIVLFSIELMMNAVNINLVAFSRLHENLIGQNFVMFTLAVAAAEAAVGLAIVISLFRNRKSLMVDLFDHMKG